MPSTAEILRNACAANGLGTSGSSSVLLARLVNASKKPTVTKSMKPMTSCKGGICKPKGKVGRPLGSKNKPKPAAAKKHTPVKGTASGGVRLSAAYYFHEVCGGKISRCEPQMITQPDGQKKLKEIQLKKKTEKAKDVLKSLAKAQKDLQGAGR